jgi:solute carrier family 25 protein 39/40
MSRQWDRPAQSAEDLATSLDEERRFHGHDRIHGDNPLPGVSSTIAMTGDNDDVEIGITAGQKMVSAMSGSLLTSLLGKTFRRYFLQVLTASVTPLDVVRVRLQSQPTQSPLAAISKLAASSPQSFSTLPPNLGVTACCREVFFANSNAEYCMAAPRIGALSTSAAAECAVEETQKRTINSTLDGLRKIARNEGITTLWRGLSPTLVMTVPANIIYFTGYDWLRFNQQSPINQRFSDNYSPLVAGALARTIAAGVVSPIEMFRTRMQASQSTGGGHFAETVKLVGEMVASHGYTSLWRGLTLTLWRDVPFSGIYWWGYETVRAALTDAREKGRGRDLGRNGSKARARSRSQSRENRTATFLDSFTAGATSGAVASILTMPFDVGKTRRQIFNDPGVVEGIKKVLAPEERSMPQFLWHIFRTEGLSGLWRGWIPRTLKVAPACAIMISSYEVGKRAFRGVNEKAEQKRLDV